MSKISLLLKFESDWHVGEGVGSSGHIDRIVRRHPEDRLPYVPAKTLTGLLRDGCEKVARGLDEGKEEGAWQQFLCGLFGNQSKGVVNPVTTSPALFSLRAACFAPELRKELSRSPELAAALVFIKPGIKVDKNGMAQSEMLRFEEVVLAGAELTAEAELNLDEGEARKAALALLAAGTKAVERLGARRRRGNGRCLLNISDAPDDIAAILGKAPPELPKSETCTLYLKQPSAPRQGEMGWHIINLDLELLSPMVIPADIQGNVIGTRDYIPGSLLLPALDKKLRKMLGGQSPYLTSFLASGHIQIRNAYPLISGRRLLPVPASLMAMKDDPGNILNKLVAPDESGVQRKQMRIGYVASDGIVNTDNGITMVKVQATTHAVVEDKSQRPTKDVGGVYTYEAIRAGQAFRSELHIAKSVLEALPDITMLEGNVRIGRAKKDDYGQGSIRASEVADSAPLSAVTNFTLWLTAPLLARDTRLRPITDAHTLTKWLSKQFQVKLKLESAYVRSFRDDGWNNAWNESRPSRFGLAAGSCFRFISTGKINIALEAEGLGERRGEGYGEVRVNAPLLELLAPTAIPIASEMETALPNSVLTATDFSKQIQQRAWRIGIRRQAVANAESFAANLDWNSTKPENSQLGALRSLFEEWNGGSDLGRLRSWVSHLRDTPRRKDKWREQTLTVLDRFADDGNAVWSYIDIGKLPQLSCHSVDEIKQLMAAEATRILWLSTLAVVFDRRADWERKKAQQTVLVEN